MTNRMLKKKDKWFGIANTLRVAAWNIRGLAHKEVELEKELKKLKIDIAAITKMKKNLWSSKELEDYSMFYNNEEEALNSIEKLLIEFAAFSTLRIANSFYHQKDIRKYTWCQRGTRPIIDYVLTNKKTAPYVEDTRVYRSADVESDHHLLMWKINIPTRWK